MLDLPAKGAQEILRSFMFARKSVQAAAHDLEILQVPHPPLIDCQRAQLPFSEPGKGRRQGLYHVTESLERDASSVNGARIGRVDRLAAGNDLGEGLRGAPHHGSQELRLSAPVRRSAIELRAQRRDPFFQFSSSETVQRGSDRPGQAAFFALKELMHHPEFGKARHLPLEQEPLDVRIPQFVERFEVVFQHPSAVFANRSAGNTAQESE